MNFYEIWINQLVRTDGEPTVHGQNSFDQLEQTSVLPVRSSWNCIRFLAKTTSKKPLLFKEKPIYSWKFTPQHLELRTLLFIYLLCRFRGELGQIADQKAHKSWHLFKELTKLNQPPPFPRLLLKPDCFSLLINFNFNSHLILF